MSSVVEGAKRLVGRGSASVPDRLEALSRAAELGRGRLDDALVDSAESVVHRAAGRLALSGNHTIVALAGATGSGKSSTFNALAGVEVATVGVRRPTTSVTSGIAWGSEGATEVLDWLGVGRRHQVSRDELGPADRSLDGLVLLDLPDHDSTEVAHHVEVDRLVQLVDLLVWVLDPQKYADAALHERYLRPLATHKDVMILVLNHIDEVAPSQRKAMVADLRRRLEEDGLDGVPVLATSARHGDGIAELRALVSKRVAAKRAAAARLSADLTAVARRMQEQNGRTDPGELRRADRSELVDAFADAAGVPTVVRAVQRSVARRGAQHTGWVVTSWLTKLKPDPLRRLHLDLGPSGKELTGLGRTSVPEPTRVQRARVDTAVRSAAGRVGDQLTPVWSDSVRRASVSRLADLNDALDKAVVGTDLGVSRTPVWWRLARFLQVLLAATMLVGALWLGVIAVLGYLQVPLFFETPEQYGLPLPTLLLLVGVVGGIALAVVGKFVNGLVARGKARTAERRLRSAIGGVTDELVIAPIERELEAYAEVRRALAKAA
ncbi:MAG TPA: GTPase [Marmoricola sp.]|nr:GTPase [Marmoricola sp.]